MTHSSDSNGKKPVDAATLMANVASSIAEGRAKEILANEDLQSDIQNGLGVIWIDGEGRMHVIRRDKFLNLTVEPSPK
jgi:hypothetical protein